MHWYTLTGESAYEVKGANGKLRPTTLRDARKLNLVPSVTTVMSVQDKPALLNWKINQVLDAVVQTPYTMFDDEQQWRAMVLRKSTEISRQAADYGSKIHDSIETHLKTGTSELAHLSQIVVDYLVENFPGFVWTAEDSFAHPLGFGGKIDLYGVRGGERMVLDFKTKQKSAGDIDDLKAYDDHHTQTAAYVKGLEDTKFEKKLDYSKWKRYNLFIGYEVTNCDLKFTGMKLTESTDFEREWGMFEKLLEFWKLKNRYMIGG